LAPQETEKIMVKIAAGKEIETINALEDFYQAFNPGFPFDYRFIDQDYQAQYTSEIRVGMLSRYFAVFAILISCLGLLGLAAFTAERRIKEIGIRKILGSSGFGIVQLLSIDFTKMVLTAIVFALPISYFIASNWLNDFTYRIDLEWWYFIGAGLIALLVAWLSVGFQSLRAARVNPVECLRNE
jgi:ABC-type antimicrobial peptide transport system permease subunit